MTIGREKNVCTRKADFVERVRQREEVEATGEASEKNRKSHWIIQNQLLEKERKANNGTRSKWAHASDCWYLIKDWLNDDLRAVLIPNRVTPFDGKIQSYQKANFRPINISFGK